MAWASAVTVRLSGGQNVDNRGKPVMLSTVLVHLSTGRKWRNGDYPQLGRIHPPNHPQKWLFVQGMYVEIWRSYPHYPRVIHRQAWSIHNGQRSCAVVAQKVGRRGREATVNASVGLR